MSTACSTSSQASTVQLPAGDFRAVVTSGTATTGGNFNVAFSNADVVTQGAAVGR